MICAKFKRTEEGYEVDCEFFGYGNANMVEAFAMENINIKNVLNSMQLGEEKVYNIGWYPNNICSRKFASEGVM